MELILRQHTGPVLHGLASRPVQLYDDIVNDIVGVVVVMYDNIVKNMVGVMVVILEGDCMVEQN